MYNRSVYYSRAYIQRIYGKINWCFKPEHFMSKLWCRLQFNELNNVKLENDNKENSFSSSLHPKIQTKNSEYASVRCGSQRWRNMECKAEMYQIHFVRLSLILWSVTCAVNNCNKVWNSILIWNATQPFASKQYQL